MWVYTCQLTSSNNGFHYGFIPDDFVYLLILKILIDVTVKIWHLVSFDTIP